MQDDLARAQQGDDAAFRAVVAPFERELRAHCYRMAGAIDDVDDLYQESLVRIWRGLPAFEARSSLRTWLHRVVASACIDRLKNRAARKRVEDAGAAVSAAALRAPSSSSPSSSSSSSPSSSPSAGSSSLSSDDGEEWIGPCPPSLYEADDVALSPEARYSRKESLSFSFLAALQLLPPKQRAALIACDVLGFSAEECAVTIESTPASVYSALARARESIAARAPAWTPQDVRAPATRALLERWLDAWNHADEKRLVALLHHDATMSMPPLPFWLRGAGDIASSIDAMVFGACGEGAFRALPVEANALPALAMYRRDSTGAYAPYALQVLAIDGDAVRGFTAFLDVRVFASFGLPAAL